MEAVGRTQAELNEAVRMLDLEKGQRFDELAATFANFEQALRKRRDVVMKNVEQEVHCYISMENIIGLVRFVND